MKKIIFITAIFIITLKMQSQQFNWAKQLGASGSDFGNSVALDAAGNVYTTGTFIGTVDFDPGPGVYNLSAPVGATNAFVSKLDAAGNFVWAKHFSGPMSEAKELVLDAAGNVILTGFFNALVDFDPGPGTYTLNTSSSDIFIAKLDGAGNFVWAKKMGGPNTDCGQVITTDAAGNVYTSGYFSGTADFDPGAGVFNLVSSGIGMFISKLNTAGNFVWAKSMDGPGFADSYGICLDASGNVLTTGRFSTTIDFDPGAGTFNLTTAGADDIFVSKLDGAGNFVWAKKVGGTSTEVANCITLDAADNIYLTGYFTATLDFDMGPTVYTLTPFGMSDIFISKWDASGSFVWAKQVGGVNNDVGNAITCDAAGNLYYTGRFAKAASNTADFDPGPGTYTLAGVAGWDIFISKLSPSGNFLWANQIGGSGNDAGNAIAVNSSGNVYTTGYFNSSADFDSGTGTYSLVSTGAEDIFINKLSPACNLTASAIFGTVSCNGGNTTVTVTPSGGYAPYTGAGNFTVTAGIYSYTVIDVNGCAATASISVTQPAAITSLQSFTLCSGQSVTVGANIYNITGTYTNVLNTINGCDSTVTTNLLINPSPTITVNSGAVCMGQSFTINPSGANSYTMQGGSNVVSPSVSSNYTVSGTSSAGCVSASTATATIIVNPNPTLSATSNNTLICVGQTVTLSVNGANTYTWNTTSTSSIIAVSPTATTIYTVTGANINGCVNVTTVTQNVSTCTVLDKKLNALSNSKVYPNPTTGTFILETAIGSHVRITNLLGKEIMSVKVNSYKQEFEFGECKSGIYFIRISDSNQQQIIRIVKE